MKKLREMLAQAKRPFVILGGGGWNAQACADIRAFAEASASAGRLRVPAARTSSTTGTRTYVGDVGIGISPALVGAREGRRPADRDRSRGWTK